MRLIRNPYMVPAIAQLRRPNPFMTPAIPQLRRPNPRGRRGNPLLRMPQGRGMGAALGSVLAVASNIAVDALASKAWNRKTVHFLAHSGLALGAASFRPSPVLAGFAGANFYAALMPAVASWQNNLALLTANKAWR